MQALYPKIRAADALMFAGPIYWFTYTAQLKACIDRFYALWMTDPSCFDEKGVALLLTYCNRDEHTSGAINAIHTFESMTRYLRTEMVGCVHGSTPAPGSAAKNEDLLARAAELGRQLARTPSK